ncbi:arrestin domain-containing protein 5 [Papilio machaon]|uniref:arrestin domain-containing protein 5 n=1 Tax=Papilio machaon TaxID=76193 RepID=UPI001E6630DD|nr:arrestin domain-containing protein 5 [Papilio machaon]
MVWENCNIVINSGDSGILYTGDVVTGSVTLEFKKVQKIKYVELRVIGISKARWSRITPTVPYLKIYEEKRKVLDTRINVFSEITGKKIRPGINNYQIHFNLPNDLPSSFKSSIATVSYYIKIMCKATCCQSKIKIVPLIVMSRVDMNHLEENKVAMMYDMNKTFATSGTLTIYFKTYRCFAPKQSLPFGIDISNDKKAKISKIVVTLIQKLEYNVTAGYANDEKKICKTEHSDFCNETKEYCRMFMDVPQTVSSSINVTNPMIKISYVLRVEVIFKFHLTLCEDIPVTITTVPVQHLGT